MKTQLVRFLSVFCLVAYATCIFPDNLQNDKQRLIYKEIFAPFDGFINKYEKEHRQKICLNGYWNFQAIPLPADYKQGKGIAPELSLPESGAWDHLPSLLIRKRDIIH